MIKFKHFLTVYFNRLKWRKYQKVEGATIYTYTEPRLWYKLIRKVWEKLSN